MSRFNAAAGKEMIPIRGPKLTTPNLHSCSLTEAARAYAENNGWYFDHDDAIYDHNKERLCSSIEELADILLRLDYIRPIRGGYLPNWAPNALPDGRAQAVRTALENK